jgi:hypothetical protein
MTRGVILVVAIAVVPIALFAVLVPIGLALKLDDLPDYAFNGSFLWTSLVAPYILLYPPLLPYPLALGLPVRTWCLVGVAVGSFTRARTLGHTAAIAFVAVVLVGEVILLALSSLGYRIAFQGP